MSKINLDENDMVRLFEAILIFLCAKSSLKYGRPINLIKG